MKYLLLLTFILVACASQRPVQETTFLTQWKNYHEGGYALPFEVREGESINFFMNIEGDYFPLVIENWQSKAQVSFNVKNKYDTTNSPAECSIKEGCDWQSVFSLKIGPHWQPGFYVAKTRDSNGRAIQIPFVIRTPESQAKTLLVYDLNSSLIQNYYSGANIESYEASLELEEDQHMENQFSINRPWLPIKNSEDKPQRLPVFDIDLFYKALKRIEPNLDIISNTSFSSIQIEKLKRYKMVTFVGEHRFVDDELLKKMDDYVSGGGKLWLVGSRYGQRRIGFSEERNSWSYTKVQKSDSLFKESFFQYSGLTVVNEKHPLVDKINLQRWGNVKGWSLSVPLIFPYSRVCIEDKSMTCEDSEIIAYASAQNKEGQKLYSPIGVIKSGEGRIVYTPHTFFKDNFESVEQFIKNLYSFFSI